MGLGSIGVPGNFGTLPWLHKVSGSPESEGHSKGDSVCFSES